MNVMQSCRLQNALKGLARAIHEVDAALEEIRANHDSLALHIFTSRQGIPDDVRYQEREAARAYGTAQLAKSARTWFPRQRCGMEAPARRMTPRPRRLLYESVPLRNIIARRCIGLQTVIDSPGSTGAFTNPSILAMKRFKRFLMFRLILLGVGIPVACLACNGEDYPVVRPTGCEVALYSWATPEGYAYQLVSDSVSEAFLRNFHPDIESFRSVRTLEAAIETLPKNASIMWRTWPPLNLSYPSNEVIAEVKAFAAAHRRQFQLVPTLE
jgi:hypothetical protein